MQYTERYARRFEFRDLRKSLGLTQREVAEAFGMTEQAIRNFEAGRTAPTKAHMLALKSLAPRE